MTKPRQTLGQAIVSVWTQLPGLKLKVGAIGLGIGLVAMPPIAFAALFLAADGPAFLAGGLAALGALVGAGAQTALRLRRYAALRERAEALEQLRSLPWRGNVRELKNVVERLLILSPGETISAKDVTSLLGGTPSGLTDGILGARTLKEFREAAERTFLLQKLEQNEWNVTRTAQAVDTPRSNLYKKMEQYGIRRRKAGEGG